MSDLGLGGEGGQGEDEEGGDEGEAMLGLLAGLDARTLAAIPPALLHRLQQLEEERDELAGRLLESDAELSCLRANYQQLSQTHASNQTWLNQLMNQQMENLERRQRRQRALAAAAAARAAAAAGGSQPQVVSIAPMSGLLDSTALETGDFDFTGEVDSVLLDQEDLAAIAASAAAAGVLGPSSGAGAAASGEGASLGTSPLKAPPSAKKLAAAPLAQVAAAVAVAATRGGADTGGAAPIDVMALAAEQPRGGAAAGASPPAKTKAWEAPRPSSEAAAKPVAAAVIEERPAPASKPAEAQTQTASSKPKEHGRKIRKEEAGSEADAAETAVVTSLASAEVESPAAKPEAIASRSANNEDAQGRVSADGKADAAAKRPSKVVAVTAERAARSEANSEETPVAKATAFEKSGRASSQGGAETARDAGSDRSVSRNEDAASSTRSGSAAASAKPKAKDAGAQAATASPAVTKAAASKLASGSGRIGGSGLPLVLALLVVVALGAGGAYVFLGGGLRTAPASSGGPTISMTSTTSDVIDAAAQTGGADGMVPPAMPAAQHAPDEAELSPSPPPAPPPPGTGASLLAEDADDDDTAPNTGAAAPDAAAPEEDEHIGFVDVYDSEDEYDDSGDGDDGAAAAAAADAEDLNSGEHVRFATLVNAPAALTPGQYWCTDTTSCEGEEAGGGSDAAVRTRALPQPSPVWDLLRAGLAAAAEEEAAGGPGSATARPQPSCESLRALASSLSATDTELASAGKQPAATPACSAGGGAGAGECRPPPSKTTGSPYPMDARAELVKWGMAELEKRWRQLQRTLERLAGEGEAKDGVASPQLPAEPAVQAVASWALGHLLPVVAPMVRSVVDDDELPESLKRAHKAASDVARVCSESGPQLSIAALGRLEAQLNDMTNIALVHVDGGGAAAVEARLGDAAHCLAWIAPRAAAEACRLRCSPRGRLVGALGRLGIPRALLDGALTLGRSGLDERDGVWRHEQPPGEDAGIEDVEAWLRSTQHLADWVAAALAAKEGDGSSSETGCGAWQTLVAAIGATLRGSTAVSDAVAQAAEVGDWRRLQLELAAEAEAAQRVPSHVLEAVAEAARRAFAQEGLSDCSGCEEAGDGEGKDAAEEAGAPGPACRAGLRSLGAEVRAVQATAAGAGAVQQGLAAAVRRIRADVMDLMAAVAVVRARCLVAAEGVLEYRKAGLAAN
ncbi:hypothetical protein HYH02_002004 [Chlamydomonas schloesseri]|nr:hypothetical protein HYH02_002004 [Chlamydomonas schloesseri]|eukprot:KAG2453795.1 hypothetical protein HYH02_002004 [Chlamydomonas schloesseri]